MKKRDRNLIIILTGLMISLGIALFLSPFASESPDGLEKVAQKLKFEHLAKDKPLVPSPMPDYEVNVVKQKGLSTSIAGAIGTLVTFLLAILVGYLISRSRRKKSDKWNTPS